MKAIYRGSYTAALLLWLAVGAFGQKPVQARYWGSRPLLPYVGLTASLEGPLRQGARLTTGEFAAMRRIAWGESEAYRRLLASSNPIVSDPNRNLDEKRLALRAIKYNQRVEAVRYAHDLALRRALGRDAYGRLAAWVEKEFGLWSSQFGVPKPEFAVRRSQIEKIELGKWFLSSAPRPVLFEARTSDASLLAPNFAPRSYKIFATRYDAKGRYTAALPDKCVKLTNGGSSICAEHGYAAGQEYSIIMRYKDSVGVTVGEAGPWNVDDTFWATAGDPTPRRMFADLALGMPEAQAAFFNGYNGGADQYGRKVTAPFAIDLAFEVADDLGLPPRTNDWITVSFMWTEAWGGGGGTNGGATAGAGVTAVETAAAGADGKVIHEVKPGQTLWAIAVAYGTTVAQLQALNGLGDAAVITTGQKLVVRDGSQPDNSEAAETPILTAETAAARPSAAERTATAAARRTAAAEALSRVAGSTQAVASPTGMRPPVDGVQNGFEPGGAKVNTTGALPDPILLAIIAAAVLGAGLILWGVLSRRSR